MTYLSKRRMYIEEKGTINVVAAHLSKMSFIPTEIKKYFYNNLAIRVGEGSVKKMMKKREGQKGERSTWKESWGCVYIQVLISSLYAYLLYIKCWSIL